MKSAFLIAGACGALAVIAVAAQNRGAGPDGPGSRLASALDADCDGVITASELRAAPSALRALDANGDGRLAAEELRPAFNPGRGDGPQPSGGRRGGADEGGDRGGAPVASADDLTDTLMAFDRDSDGRLDRTEVPERFQGLFERADANKDGALTRDELKQSATASMTEANQGGRGGRGGEFGRGRGGMMADPLMRALDSDHDGLLSEAEIAAAAAALRPLDVNQDGQLSADEFRPQPGRGRDGREGGRR